MSQLIQIDVGDARIVHDKAVVCKEGGPWIDGMCCDLPICTACAFENEDCKDIACAPLQREDGKFVYFQPV